MTALRDLPASPAFTYSSAPEIVPGWVIECDSDLTKESIEAFHKMWAEQDRSMPLLLGKGMRLRSMAEYNTPQMALTPLSSAPSLLPLVVVAVLAVLNVLALIAVVVLR